jgi:hypothetical protein
MNNLDRDIHNLLIEKIGTVPESEYILVPRLGKEGICGYDRHYVDGEYDDRICIPSYSTDQLIDELLPPELIGKRIYSLTFGNSGHRRIVVYRTALGEELDWLSDIITVDTINQALKQLFKWVIINYPEQLREHLERRMMKWVK